MRTCFAEWSWLLLSFLSIACARPQYMARKFPPRSDCRKSLTSLQLYRGSKPDLIIYTIAMTIPISSPVSLIPFCPPLSKSSTMFPKVEPAMHTPPSSETLHLLQWYATPCQILRQGFPLLLDPMLYGMLPQTPLVHLSPPNSCASRTTTR